MPAPQETVLTETIGHAVSLLRVEAGFRTEIIGLLKELEQRLAEQLFTIDPGGAVRSAARQRRLETLLEQTRETILGAYSTANVAHGAQMRELAKIESQFAAGLLGEVKAVVGFETTALTPGQLQQIASKTLIEGAPSREWWARQSRGLRERFTNEMRMGLLAGETNEQLIRRVRGTATGRRNIFVLNGVERTFVEFSGGLMETSTRHAANLVRTSVQAVANETSRQTFLENQDVVKGLMQVSTLDSRTTPVCIAYDGKAWSYPDMEPVGHSLPFQSGTPRHHGCRSREIPWLKSWREMGLDIDEVSSGTRASLHGQLPPETTWDEFFGRLTQQDQDQLIGKGKAQLWREGRLTATQLVNMEGVPLKLSELQKTLPSAAAVTTQRPLTAAKLATEAEVLREQIEDLEEVLARSEGELRQRLEAVQESLVSASGAERASLVVEQGSLRRQLKSAVFELEAGKQNAREAFFGALRLGREGTPIEYELSRGLTRRARAQISQGVAFLESVWGGSALPQAIRFVPQAGRRSGAVLPLGEVLLARKGRGAISVVHEVAHFLEFWSPNLRQRLFEFYERRTVGEALVEIGEGEFSRPDGFADIYMGKEYLDENGALFATELLTVGLEMLFSAPWELVEKDPEFFEFLVSLFP